MNNKILALIAVVLVVSGIGTGAIVLNQNNNTSGVQDYAITTPSSSTKDINNSTIYAVNSTIIAGDGSTIINPSESPTVSPTVSPTQAPMPTVTPTPGPDMTITYTQIAYNESERIDTGQKNPQNDSQERYIVYSTVTYIVTVSDFSERIKNDPVVTGFSTSSFILNSLTFPEGNRPPSKVICDIERVNFNSPPTESFTIKLAYHPGDFETLYSGGYSLEVGFSLASMFKIEYVKI